MPDSERTFKTKVRLPWAVFEFFFYVCYMCILRVLHENEIFQYLQNYKRHEFDQGHSKKLL